MDDISQALLSNTAAQRGQAKRELQTLQPPRLLRHLSVECQTICFSLLTVACRLIMKVWLDVWFWCVCVSVSLCWTCGSGVLVLVSLYWTCGSGVCVSVSLCWTCGSGVCVCQSVCAGHVVLVCACVGQSVLDMWFWCVHVLVSLCWTCGSGVCMCWSVCAGCVVLVCACVGQSVLDMWFWCVCVCVSQSVLDMWFWCVNVKIKICQTAYFELKHISSVRRFLTEDATKTLVTSYILSQLDCCNCLLMGTPNSVIQPLQKIQNFAARLVLLAPRHHHATPLLEKLHWLPISERIKYKVACMCFSAINGSGPAYLSELLHVYTPSHTLHSSSDTRMLEIQQYKRKTHGFRTFSCFGPHIWNSLPQDLRHCSTLSSFKAKLKTFLFSQYFHPN